MLTAFSHPWFPTARHNMLFRFLVLNLRRATSIRSSTIESNRADRRARTYSARWNTINTLRASRPAFRPHKGTLLVSPTVQ